MENKWNLFEKFLITENQTISIEDFATNSVLIIILCWILGLTYQKVARSLSNKKDFANNFMVLAFTTMLIISIVKSSLALSLGLVGALSIVRFRAAIKEPEELAFLFFSISIGLGLGANQIAIVLVAFLIFMVILWGRFFFQKKDQSQNLFITVNSSKNKIEIGELNNIMSNHFKKHQLRRFDEQEEVTELAFIADVKSSAELESFRKDILRTYPNTNISFLDSKAY
jgi:hypothetical protein